MFSVRSSKHGSKTLWAVFIGEKEVAGPYASESHADSRAQELAKAHHARAAEAKLIQDHENLVGIYETLINKTPLTVGEFLDIQMPGRRGVPEFEALFPHLVQMLNILALSDTAKIDMPIHEGAIIHGITSQGMKSYEIYLRDYAPK